MVAGSYIIADSFGCAPQFIVVEMLTRRCGRLGAPGQRGTQRQEQIAKETQLFAIML
jgi:hypothetical protein